MQNFQSHTCDMSQEGIREIFLSFQGVYKKCIGYIVKFLIQIRQISDFGKKWYFVERILGLSPLLFISVLEALSREFHTGCPWELLYADDLMISAGSMEELLVKVQTWKTEMEKKGLRVNMGKTKIMESGINLDVLKKSGKYPCGVCQSGVGSSNAIFYGGCKRWVHKKCSGIHGPLRPDPEFRCARCLGTARAIDEREVSELRLETKSLKLSQSSATLGTFSLQEVAAS